MRLKTWHGLPIGFAIITLLAFTVLDPAFAGELAAYFIIIYSGVIIWKYLANRLDRQKKKGKTPI